MKRKLPVCLATLCTVATLCVAAAGWLAATRSAAEPASRPYGLDKGVPWTTSRVTGSPEPPRPYRIVRAFPQLTFKNPLLLANAPGCNRLFVGEQAGKLYSFPNDQAAAKADLFLDLTTELKSWQDQKKVKGVDAVYGLAFHPKYAKNRYCYVCYVLASTSGEQLDDGTRVSRFTVTDADPPRCEPGSEKVLITWKAGGHNGGCLQFGPDGYLYISTGDATDPNPPDKFDTGQDISDLLSSILRIDVDREDGGKPYATPADNPFVKTPGARPEVWAYGLRNPWRMSFDRANGDLWVGDVGWELWEMVYRVRRGGNYGWSVMEGRQTVRPEAKRGPTPILPPTLDFPHTEAASITGGYVYRGKKHADLVGAYICGDWMTCKVWGTRFAADDKILSHRELAQGSQRIVAFGEDNDGELYFLNYHEQGTVLQLVPNDIVPVARTQFPTKLSETGLFASVKDQRPAPGVVPFAINASMWQDHATAERLVGLPGASTVRLFETPQPVPGTAFFNGRVFFPKDGVLAKTLSLELERGKPSSRRPVETQVLHFDGVDWRGYSYRWNDEATDAELVPAAGAERRFSVADAAAPGGRRQQTWHFPSRAECLTCHNGWAGGALAFTEPQLDREYRYGPIADNQLRTLAHVGVIELAGNKGAPRGKLKALADPFDAAAPLDARARSYLHVNCSHCHQFGAGGTALIELRADVDLAGTKLIGARPAQGTFEIAGASLVSANDPCGSVLLYRVGKLGRGRMPHIGSDFVDERGLRLLHDWIAALPAAKPLPPAIAALRREEQSLVDKLRELTHSTNPLTGTTRAETIDHLLGSTSGALALSLAVADGRLAGSLTEPVAATAAARPEPQIRDLFERFLPDERRVQRLGVVIKPERILALKGDVGRGKELFYKAAATQCVNCHRVGGVGSTLGPDLSQVGKKSSRAEILESILEPSKKIDPAYVTYLLETKDGQVHTGLLGVKTTDEVVLKTAGDKEIRVPAKKVETLAPQKVSLMPELLARDLTAEQLADLLEFLTSLK